jgi:hypothetical protein
MAQADATRFLMMPKEFADRVKKIEEEVGKSKRLALLATILAAVLGSGGIFSVVQWAYSGPKFTRKLNRNCPRFS